MRVARDFLSSLHGRGIKLWNENGQLRFQAPKGKLHPDEINKLRELKAEIMELLARPELATTKGMIEPRPGA